MEVLNIGVYNEEQKRALKAFAKALKMEVIGTFKVSHDTEKQQIINSIIQGYKESLDIDSGKIKSKTIEQLLDEL